MAPPDQANIIEQLLGSLSEQDLLAIDNLDIAALSDSGKSTLSNIKKIKAEQTAVNDYNQSLDNKRAVISAVPRALIKNPLGLVDLVRAPAQFLGNMTYNLITGDNKKGEYFGISDTAEKALDAVGLGTVYNEDGTQNEYQRGIEFITPSLGGKAIPQAITGATSYLGGRVADWLYPNSPKVRLAGEILGGGVPLAGEFLLDDFARSVNSSYGGTKTAQEATQALREIVPDALTESITPLQREEMAAKTVSSFFKDKTQAARDAFEALPETPVMLDDAIENINMFAQDKAGTFSPTGSTSNVLNKINSLVPEEQTIVTQAGKILGEDGRPLIPATKTTIPAEPTSLPLNKVQQDLSDLGIIADRKSGLDKAIVGKAKDEIIKAAEASIPKAEFEVFKGLRSYWASLKKLGKTKFGSVAKSFDKEVPEYSKLTSKLVNSPETLKKIMTISTPEEQRNLQHMLITHFVQGEQTGWSRNIDKSYDSLKIAFGDDAAGNLLTLFGREGTVGKKLLNDPSWLKQIGARSLVKATIAASGLPIIGPVASGAGVVAALATNVTENKARALAAEIMRKAAVGHPETLKILNSPVKGRPFRDTLQRLAKSLSVEPETKAASSVIETLRKDADLLSPEAKQAVTTKAEPLPYPTPKPAITPNPQSVFSSKVVNKLAEPEPKKMTQMALEDSPYADPERIAFEAKKLEESNAAKAMDDVPEPPKEQIIRDPKTDELIVAGNDPVELPLSQLELSDEVTNFKKNANAKGVVTRLEGKFDKKGTGPIQVWRRLDGRLQVISGRHRLELANRTEGKTTILAQVYNEADGFDAKAAARLDAELNIRDGHGAAEDFSRYFRYSDLTLDEAKAANLLRSKEAADSFIIASDGSANLYSGHQSGQLDTKTAAAIAKAAPKDESLQLAGIRAAKEGVSADQMESVLMVTKEGAKKGSSGSQGGFFDDDSYEKFVMAQAKLADSGVKEIKQQIASIRGAQKRPETATKLGLPVTNAKELEKTIQKMESEIDKLENWHKHKEVRSVLEDFAKKDMKSSDAVKEMFPLNREFGDFGKKKIEKLEMLPEVVQQRAKNMGFSDKIYYHGTTGDVRAFDLSHAGANTKAEDTTGVWMSSEPSVANTFARNLRKKRPEFSKKEQELEDVFMSKVARSRRLISETETATIQRKAKIQEEYGPLQEEIERIGNEMDLHWHKGANVLPLRTSVKNPLVYNMQGKDWDPKETVWLIEQAIENGNDSLMLENVIEGYSLSGGMKPSTSLLVFDPKKIRSVFAKFDPSKKDSSDLLASIMPFVFAYSLNKDVNDNN